MTESAGRIVRNRTSRFVTQVNRSWRGDPAVRKTINVYRTAEREYQVNTSQADGKWKEEPGLVASQVVDRLVDRIGDLDGSTALGFWDGSMTRPLASIPPDIRDEFFRRQKRNLEPAEGQCPHCHGTRKVGGMKCRCEL
jgi:hypothetical protein